MIYKFNPDNYNKENKTWLGIPHDKMEEMFGKNFMDTGFYGKDGCRLAIAVLSKNRWGASMGNFVPKCQENATEQVDRDYRLESYAVGTPDGCRFRPDLERCGQICDYPLGDNEPTLEQMPKEDETQSCLDKIEEDIVSVDDIRSIIRAEIAEYDMNKTAEETLQSFLDDINKLKEKKMEKPQTLRQKLRYAALPKDDKILRESGFYDSTGALTEQGRRIVVDMLWDTLGADDRKKVVEAVEATLPKEK